MNKDQAIDNLMYSDHKSLAETVYFMYKDQYGHKAHHMFHYTIPELASWIVSHYDWDERNQMWASKVPLDEDLNLVLETIQ